jgi:hypothetical protein
MTAPQVFVIYWDSWFNNNPQVVHKVRDFFKDILTGTYMSQLAQYGVGLGKYLNEAIIPSNLPPGNLSPAQIVVNLQGWIASNTVPLPQANLLYVIFTPQNTKIGDPANPLPPECLAGFHGGQGNLFWAAIQEWHENPPPTNPDLFADSCTWAVSHEMVEAFTNPDAVSGWAARIKNPDGTQTICEIADICECATGTRTKKTQILKGQIQGQIRNWMVESYWDNANGSCYPLSMVPQKAAPAFGYEYTKPKEHPQGRRV